MEIPDPLLSLAGRCSGPAWDRLKALRGHALFEALLQALRPIEGTILEIDVDQAFLRLIQHETPRESSKGSASSNG